MGITSSLDLLNTGQTARILDLNGDGAIRQRLMDLGFTPGTNIQALYSAVSGDPTAYRVRGTVIALRADDAANITTEACQGDS